MQDPANGVPRKPGHPTPHHKERQMARLHHTQAFTRTEDAPIVLFCLIDDGYEAIKRLSDSKVLTLTLLQQPRGVESERWFLRYAQRFFSHLFPRVVGLHPSSSHRRVRRLRRFLEPLRCSTQGARGRAGDPDRG